MSPTTANELNSANDELLAAAYKGDLEAIIKALKAKANVNSANNNRNTALIKAAYGGHTEIVQALIAARADVNLADYDGDTALIWASRRGRTGTVQALIKAGANVNHTALIEAVEYGNTETIQALIAARTHEYTALIVAVEYGNTETIQALIAARADVNLADNDGRTALIEASRNGNLELEVTYALLQALLNQDTPASQPGYLPSAHPAAQIPTSSSSSTETASPSSEMKLGS